MEVKWRAPRHRQISVQGKKTQTESVTNSLYHPYFIRFVLGFETASCSAKTNKKPLPFTNRRVIKKMMMLTVCVSHRVAHLDLCGLSVCPRLKRISQPGGRDAPASPSLPTDSPAVETSSHSPSYTHGIICLPKHRWDDAEARLIFPPRSHLGFSNQ